MISTSSPTSGKLERGVHGVAERVEDRAQIRLDAVLVHPDVALRDDHVLGERAVSLHPDRDGPDAHLTPTGPAVAADAADDVAFAGHPVPHLDVANIITEGDDLAVELVARG